VQVDGEGGKAEEEPTPVQSESFLTYHFVMFILAVYTAMMFTDWGHPPEASRGHNQKYNQGFASAWLQMTANWICSLLYLWTLVAPKLHHGKLLRLPDIHPYAAHKTQVHTNRPVAP